MAYAHSPTSYALQYSRICQQKQLPVFKPERNMFECLTSRPAGREPNPAAAGRFLPPLLRSFNRHISDILQECFQKQS